MQWIGSDGFLMMYRDFRTVWLSGRFGSGKTATALALSSWLTGNAYSSIVCANIPIYGAEFPPPIPLTDAALIIDEAHLYLDAWRDVRRYTAFLRKVNLRLAMPSIYPPHARLRMLELQRIYNWYNMSIPMWQYKWRVNAGMFSETGWAFLWKPHEIFRFYDTEDILMGKGDGYISDAIQATLQMKAIDRGEVSQIEREYQERLARIVGSAGADHAGEPPDKRTAGQWAAGRQLAKEERAAYLAELPRRDREIPVTARRSDEDRAVQQATLDALSDVSTGLADATSGIGDAAQKIERAAKRIHK